MDLREVEQRHCQNHLLLPTHSTPPTPHHFHPSVKKALAAVERRAEERGVLALSEPQLRAWAGLPPPAATPTEEAAARAAAPDYSPAGAQAYAVARLAASHAALARVFAELAARLPGFRPRLMLDYGAGPGTAIWAAADAWPGVLARAHAVEPSPHMARLGRLLEAARHDALRSGGGGAAAGDPHAPPPLGVSWHPDLASLVGVPGARRGGAAYGSRRRFLRGRARPDADDGAAELGFARGVLAGRLRRVRRRYPLVVASYVLSEVAGPRERAALVARLWSEQYMSARKRPPFLRP